MKSLDYSFMTLQDFVHHLSSNFLFLPFKQILCTLGLLRLHTFLLGIHVFILIFLFKKKIAKRIEGNVEVERWKE